MLLGTFFERMRAALKTQTCIYCEHRPVQTETLFCRTCADVLSLRTPQAVIDTAYFQCHAATTFNPQIKRLLYAYKFYDREDFAPKLSGLLIQYWQQLLQGQMGSDLTHPENTLVVPIPSHDPNDDRVERLASRFSRHFGYEYRTDALFWVRSVEPQHGILDKRQRFVNIANSLRVDWHAVQHHEKIVVVDDLTTTGATLHEASRAFRDAFLAHESRSEVITLAISKMPLVRPVR